MCLFLLLLGCGEARRPEPQEDGKKAPAKGFARTLQRENAKNELRNLALFYLQFLDTNRGRPPANVDQFIEFFKRDANALYKAVKDGYYIVNLKAKLGGTAIIAYEAEPDERDNVLVVRGDAVSTMSITEVRRELEQP